MDACIGGCSCCRLVTRLGRHNGHSVGDGQWWFQASAGRQEHSCGRGAKQKGPQDSAANDRRRGEGDHHGPRRHSATRVLLPSVEAIAEAKDLRKRSECQGLLSYVRIKAVAPLAGLAAASRPTLSQRLI